MLLPISPDKIQEVAQAANEQIELVLDTMGLCIENSCGDEIRMACPVHGGNNPTSFAYNKRYKSWRCYTNSCHTGNSSIFGLYQKLRNRQENIEVGFPESVKYIAGIVGVCVNGCSEELSVDDIAVRNILKESRAKIAAPSKQRDFRPFPVEMVKSKSAEYFLKQGFSEEVLNKYKVGFCDVRGKPMYKRSYAPILDDTGRWVLGVTGRTIYEKCEFCPSFHEQGKGCPRDNPLVRSYPKWLHFGFDSNSVFYNLNFAKPHLNLKKTAIIVESPKNVWWFEQHGIHNSLCIFGLNLFKSHIKKLAENNVINLTLALDKDESGIEAIDKIRSTTGLYFNITDIHHLMKSGEDIADIPTDRMLGEIVPWLS